MSDGDARRQRDAEVRRVLLAILGANLAVAALEIGLGLWAGSRSILADGLHTILDSSNNVLGLVVVRFASAPPDAGHPYGHRKFEVVGSVAIGIVLLLMVWEVGQEAIAGLLGHSPPPRFGVAAFVVMGITLAINIVVTLTEHRAARRLQSPLLLADARHTLADIFVKLGVIAGIIGNQLGWQQADSVAALGVLAFITWIGAGIVRRGVGILTDEAMLDPSEVEAIALAVGGVRSCARVRSRGMPGDLAVDLMVTVDPGMTLHAAHEIADRVEDAIREAVAGISDIVVHVEPHEEP